MRLAYNADSGGRIAALLKNSFYEYADCNRLLTAKRPYPNKYSRVIASQVISDFDVAERKPSYHDQIVFAIKQTFNSE